MVLLARKKKNSILTSSSFQPPGQRNKHTRAHCNKTSVELERNKPRGGPLICGAGTNPLGNIDGFYGYPATQMIVRSPVSMGEIATSVIGLSLGVFLMLEWWKTDGAGVRVRTICITIKMRETGSDEERAL